jgi:hypothetical protein
VIKLKKALSIVFLITFFACLPDAGEIRCQVGKMKKILLSLQQQVSVKALLNLPGSLGVRKAMVIKVDFNLQESDSRNLFESGVKADIFALPPEYMDELKIKDWLVNMRFF